jgi:hypothetical protein
MCWKLNTGCPGAEEAQHMDNTIGMAFLGTRRHNCYDDDVSSTISQNASELGWVIWLAMVAKV